MRVLILSCNTGEGHNAAGKAIQEMFINHGHQADLLDFVALKSDFTSRIVSGAYIWITKHAPGFFSVLYKIAMVISSSRYKSPVYLANIPMAKYLLTYLREHFYDVIITPHLYPAETITYLKRHHKLVTPTIVVGTDYTCIPFFEEIECECDVIASENLMEEYIARGIPRKKLYPYGIPVSDVFLAKKGQEAIKERLALKKEKPMFLVMGGSMGFGKIQLFTLKLLQNCNNKESVVVICGRNKKLYTTLKKKFGNRENVKIIGYTKHVAEIMDAADVIFTKPGGLTSTEVAVKNKPLIHTSPIPGCETANAKFFSEHNLSCYEESIEGQIADGVELLYDKEKKESMIKSQQQVIHADAARKIMNLALTLVKGE